MELLYCPKCGAELSGDRVNMNTGLATCGSCSAVFTIGSTPEPAYDGSYKDVATPDGVTVTENDHGLMIESKASKTKALGIVFFAVFWNIVLFGFMLPGFFGSGIGAMGLVILPFVAVGVGMAYYAVVLLVNKNYITASDKTLSFATAPLPWFGNSTLDRADVKQLFVREQYHRSSSSSGRSRTYYTYDLTVMLANGGRKKLLSLQKPENALFFERSIEEYLGIEDTRVSGEMQG